MYLFEQDVIETVITSMVVRKQVRSADSKLMADDTSVCFRELRAHRTISIL
jgi:hypothetical protein